MKKLFLPLLILLLTGCSEKKEDPMSAMDNVEKPTHQSLEEMVNHHIEAQLSIPSTEKYSMKIYKEHLDGDDKMDAIITVNRLNFAMAEAEKSGNSAKMAEIGFTGNYNYIFYYDGMSNSITPPIVISSSPHAELKLKFENVQSDAYKDILVDYTIRNSQFRNFFTIMNHSPRLVFQWKIYDGLGTDQLEVNYLEFAPGTQSAAKDILVYNGNLENAASVKDIYQFEPKITKKGEVIHRFFYLDAQGKYFTQK